MRFSRGSFGSSCFETGLAGLASKAPFEIQADVKALLRHCSYLGPPLELWRHSCVKSHQIFTTPTLKVGNGHLPLSVPNRSTQRFRCRGYNEKITIFCLRKNDHTRKITFGQRERNEWRRSFFRENLNKPSAS